MILDTNAVSALFAGDESLALVLRDGDRHHLPSVVLGEYRYGLARSRHREQLSPLLDSLAAASHVLTVDEWTAIRYTAVRNELRQQGTPIPENDVWIAALARQHALPVVSRDRHFDLVDGLDRRAW